MHPFRRLTVWQKAHTLALETHRCAERISWRQFPGLADQLRRAVMSIPANIAEGHARGTRKDYARFVSTARGSLAETETLLVLAVNVELLNAEAVEPALVLCIEFSKMLTALLNRLRDIPSQSL